MPTYKIVSEIVFVAEKPATMLRLSFGEPAQNDQIVVDAIQALAAVALEGGELVLLNGPASLPVAVAIAHGVGHLFQAVGVFDPKLAGYVVAVCHGGIYSPGQIIPAAEVVASE